LLALYRQDEQEQERYMNLERLIATLSEYVQSSPAPSLREYLQQVALMSESELVPDSADAVTLMTLHAAKGLEFSVVFITGLEQGLLPLARATESREELEEERRLLYVGMTRARERLYLSYAQHRWRWGESILCRPSDFLQELPPELLEPIPSPTAAPGVPFQSALRASATEGMEEDGLYPGARVRHPVFGVGTVEALSGSGENRRAVVRFPHVGRKLLLLRYARLQLLHR
jgi:DNA helicase-2/ATP-dependent DNA helicase PcrA